MISGNSEGHYLTRFTYPTDLGGQMKYLVDANMIGVPVEVTEYKNGNIVSGSKTEFTQVNYSYQPRVYYKLNTEKFRRAGFSSLWRPSSQSLAECPSFGIHL